MRIYNIKEWTGKSLGETQLMVHKRKEWRLLNNFQCISTLQKKAVRIVNKNIFKMFNIIFILTNTNNLFVCTNILKCKDLITYKKYIIHAKCIFKGMPKQNIIISYIYIIYIDIIIYTKILFIILNYLI